MILPLILLNLAPSPSFKDSVILPTGTKAIAIHAVAGKWQTLSGKPYPIQIKEKFTTREAPSWGIVLVPKSPYDMNFYSKVGAPTVDVSLDPRIPRLVRLSNWDQDIVPPQKGSFIALFTIPNIAECPKFNVAEGAWKVASSAVLKNGSFVKSLDTKLLENLTKPSGKSSKLTVLVDRSQFSKQYAYNVRAYDGNKLLTWNGTFRTGDEEVWNFGAKPSDAIKVNIVRRPYTEINFK